jgi:hypothetical protein
MFDMFKKDKPFPIDEEEVNANEFEWDGTPNCLNAWTDGSFSEGRAGWGVWFDWLDGVQMLSSIYGPVPGRKTNNRAELQAVLEALK